MKACCFATQKGTPQELTINNKTGIKLLQNEPYTGFRQYNGYMNSV